MFNAPQIYLDIPDLYQLYDINSLQAEELDNAIQQLDDNLFLSTMGVETIERWEKILKITKLDTDTIETRRARIQTKVIERVPYTYRVVLTRLNALCPNGCILVISDDRLSVNPVIKTRSKELIDDINAMLEDMLPLNMIYGTSIQWDSSGNIRETLGSGIAAYPEIPVLNNIKKSESQNLKEKLASGAVASPSESVTNSPQGRTEHADIEDMVAAGIVSCPSSQIVNNVAPRQTTAAERQYVSAVARAETTLVILNGGSISSHMSSKAYGMAGVVATNSNITI